MGISCLIFHYSVEFLGDTMWRIWILCIYPTYVSSRIMVVHQADPDYFPCWLPVDVGLPVLFNLPFQADLHPLHEPFNILNAQCQVGRFLSRPEPGRPTMCCAATFSWHFRSSASAPRLSRRLRFRCLDIVLYGGKPLVGSNIEIDP